MDVKINAHVFGDILCADKWTDLSFLINSALLNNCLCYFDSVGGEVENI